MEFNDALAKILEAIDDVSVYENELEIIRNGNIAKDVKESDEYKDLSDQYNELKAKYKRKFIDTLTQEVKPDGSDEPNDSDEPDDLDGNISFEDLDLSGESD